MTSARAGFVAVLLLALGCGGAAAEGSPPAVATSPETTGAARGPEARASGERGGASYYSDKLAGRSTASGEPYEPSKLTAAHRTLPFGTIVEVAREDGRKVEVRINDRGPFKRGRVIDLSRRAAEELGMIRDGVIDVVVRVVKEAPPKRSRR